MLWLTYGITILLAFIPVLFGYRSIMTTKFSYSMSFSTTMRAMSHAHVSVPITREDAIGQDPLPKHLAKAMTTFDIGWQGEKQSEDDVSGNEDVEVLPLVTPNLKTPTPTLDVNCCDLLHTCRLPSMAA